VRFLSRGENKEYARLATAIREKYPKHYAEFIFALNTGLRLSSQYGATYGMIDWKRNVLDVPRTKNAEPVHVPLNSDVARGDSLASIVARSQRADFPQSAASREAGLEQRSLVQACFAGSGNQRF